MFRTAFQRGFLTVFYSVGSKPLEIWDVHMENGHIARLLDPDLKSMVLDIRGNNVSTAYITCPSKNRILGITMPFMIMIVKNLKKYFTFEVTIMDDTGSRRRFRVSNFQSTTQILPMSTAMPIGLAEGWNQIQFNLSEFTRRAYNKTFVEVQKIKVNANIRLRRIYFAERLTPEEDLPPEYRIFLPLPSKKGKKPVAAGGSKTGLTKGSSKQAMASPGQLKSASQASVLQIPPPAPPVEEGPKGMETPDAGGAPAGTEAPSPGEEAPAQEPAATAHEPSVTGEATPEATPDEGAAGVPSASEAPESEAAPADEPAPEAEP